jgi:hypothetical protein
MYAFTQDVPIGRDVYARIRKGLGDDAPDGLLVHLAIEQPDGTLRYVDVWRDQESSDRFHEHRLHPVVHPALQAAGIEIRGDAPRHPIEVVDVWGAAVTDPVSFAG